MRKQSVSLWIIGGSTRVKKPFGSVLIFSFPLVFSSVLGLLMLLIQIKWAKRA